MGATWHHTICREKNHVSVAQWYTCLLSFLPYQHTFPVIVCHVSPYGCATCHHCKGDTCHLLIGPTYSSMSVFVRPFILPCVTSRRCQLCLPCQLYDRTTYTVNCHVALYRLYNHHFLSVWKNEQIAIT
jgi:hypothetical protein